MDELVLTLKFGSRVKNLAKSYPIEVPVQLDPVQQWIEQNPSNPESVKNEKAPDTASDRDTLSGILDIPTDAVITSSGSDTSGKVTPGLIPSRSESPDPFEVNTKILTKKKLIIFKQKIGKGTVLHNIPENPQKLGKLLDNINALERLITMSSKRKKE